MFDKLQLTYLNKIRLDKALAEELAEFSRTKIQHLIRSENVTVNDQIITDPAFTINGTVSINISEPVQKPSLITPQNIPLEILFEDEHLLVINKPAGIIVHPGSGNRDNTLINALLFHCGNSLSQLNGTSRPGIVHRLDKDTSGVLVIVKKDKAHHLLSEQFQKRTIIKKYIAFCIGVPKLKINRIETLLSRNKKNRIAMQASNITGKVAITNYKTLEVFGNAASKIACHIVTGRTHQIRVHMAHIGTPVIGDKIYMNKNITLFPKLIRTFPRQALHAYSIQFQHPLTKETIFISANLPPDLLELETNLLEIIS